MSVGPPFGNWRRVLIRPHYLDDVLRSALLGSPEIIFWRNCALFFSFAQITVAVLSFPLFFLRRSFTVIAFNICFALQGLIAIHVFSYFKTIGMLAFCGVQGGFLVTTFAYLLLFIIFKGQWMLLVVHITMLVDAVLWVGMVKASLVSHIWYVEVFLPQRERHAISVRAAYESDQVFMQASVPQAPVAVGARANIYSESSMAQPSSPPPSSAQRSLTDLVEEATDGVLVCPICLTYKSNGCLIPCGHMLCWKCIQERFPKGAQCPMCRTRITFSQRTHF